MMKESRVHVAPQDAVILVVEDNFDNLSLITDMLRVDVGARYVNARASGWQLLKLVEKLPDTTIHLILLDIQIPHEDGYQVLQHIRKHPRLQHVRVVAVTANIMSEYVRRAEALGFDGFIGKPLKFDAFPEQVCRILRGEAVWEPF